MKQLQQLKTFLDEPKGCGIHWLWMLPKGHPWEIHCNEHDDEYDRINRWWFRGDWKFVKNITKDAIRDKKIIRALAGAGTYPIITAWNIFRSVQSYTRKG